MVSLRVYCGRCDQDENELVHNYDKLQYDLIVPNGTSSGVGSKLTVHAQLNTKIITTVRVVSFVLY